MQKDDLPAKVMLEGLKYGPMRSSAMGCLQGCAAYLYPDMSAAWVHGGTAGAFVLCIAEELDHAGPTAWRKFELYSKLGPNVGLEVQEMVVRKGDVTEEQFEKATADAWRFVREALAAGEPCYGWAMDRKVPESSVITGYDETGYYCSGKVAKPGPFSWEKYGHGWTGMIEISRVRKCGKAPDEKVVADALTEVVRSSDDPRGWRDSGEYTSGLAGYEAWANMLESGTAPKVPHAFYADAWRQCREHAVDFLVEARQRLPGRCDEAFDKAIAQYGQVRDCLAKACEMHPYEGGWDGKTMLTSPEAAAVLRDAADAEREGVAALARVVEALS